ncbi:MAG: hypothetical protein Q3962_02355 [Corynebacterium sp.]|nr:hypothetical protein [Corynebacterium sp.]
MTYPQQALAKAATEALDLVENSGRPHLFGLVDAAFLSQAMPGIDADPLNLILEEFPQEVNMKDSASVRQYVSTVTWPEQVCGAAFGEVITFDDEEGIRHEGPMVKLVLRNGQSITLLRMEDQSLRGGDNIAPEVADMLAYTLTDD